MALDAFNHVLSMDKVSCLYFWVIVSNSIYIYIYICVCVFVLNLFFRKSLIPYLIRFTN